MTQKLRFIRRTQSMRLSKKPGKKSKVKAPFVKNSGRARVWWTPPHIDAFEVGYEIGTIMIGTLFGKIKPVIAVKHLPLMNGPPLNVVTADMPIKHVYDRAKFMQRTISDVWASCHGYRKSKLCFQGR